MIKDQCIQCKIEESCATKQMGVYDGSSCEDYVKRFDLSKPTDKGEPEQGVLPASPVDGITGSGSASGQPSVGSDLNILNALFSLQGRRRRTQFWQIFALNSVLQWLFALMLEPNGLYIFLLFICVWIAIANFTKRLHDLGRSGWNWFFCLIPFINIGLFIYVGFFKGDEFDNRYGANPY